MKIRYTFAIIVGLILFFIPFFWLKPGEMNLGGDSGRLYFYDPSTFLNLNALYNYTRSGNGGEVVNYIYLPYVALLSFLKLIFQSPTILISLFNGLTLSVAFFSTYLIVKELLKGDKHTARIRYIEPASILAGLFYLFSQLSIHSGWENQIITHHQIFLNPLITLLILKFILMQKIRYLIFALLTTFIFTPNFSFIGAPPFFAFYPITILFVFFYAKFIRKVHISYKFIVIGLALFLLIQAFHLANETRAIFSPESAYYRTVFAQGGISSRDGLNYFIAVAANIKVSQIWMSLAQFQKEPYFAIFIIFPLALVASFFLNRGKTLLLTGLFFLTLLYFTSAITEVGFFAYKQLFKIPGFSMFRNFHAQWSYVFFFFYAILFGQAIAIVANKVRKHIALFILGVFSIVIIAFGMPLLTGSVSIITNKDTGVRYAFRMDSIYEQVLRYFRTDPIDGRVLVFPLTGSGYQIFQGKDGGVYLGLPTISYLSGKSEIGGYETLRPFQDVFLNAMSANDYETLRRLFSIMNVRQLFYNSDPYIYSEPFKAYLYDVVSRYAPKDQEAYKVFIEKLPVTKAIDFGDMYHIYPVNSDVYLPHIFTTEEVRYTNDSTALTVDSNFQKDLRQTVLPIQSIIGKDDPIILYGLPKTFLTEFRDNSHFHKHDPFIKRQLTDFLYHFITLKEKYDLARVKNDSSRYLNTALLLLSKRKGEMVDFGNSIDILKKPWQEPQLWEVYKWFSYNSWEASLARYEKGAEKLIDWVEKDRTSQEQRIFNLIKINEQLHQHEMTLLRTIRRLNKKTSEKEHLLSLINSMYERLYGKVDIPRVDLSLYIYRLPAYVNRQGSYEMYLEDKDISIQDQSRITMKLENQIGKPILESKDRGLLRFPDVRLDEYKDLEATITMPIKRSVKKARWVSSGFPIENADGSVTMVFDNKAGELAEGLTLEIPDWTPANTYLISFDYDTNGDDFIFSFFDKRPVDDTLRKVSYKVFFEKRLRSQGFKTYQSIFLSEKDTVSGFLQILPFSLPQKDTSTVKIQNLIVEKISYPQLVFKKIVPEVQVSRPPQVTFTRINPAKYVIDIKGATSPYALVFLDSFNQNWKLIDPASPDKTAGGRFSRAFGSLARIVTNLFVKDKSNKEGILTSYFNGEVREGIHENTFLTPSTFEAWGKKTIADKTHSQAFEYANAWLIKPEDLDGKTDYALILELKTQRWFYPALLVSLITVVCLLTYSMGKILLWLRKR